MWSYMATTVLQHGSELHHLAIWLGQSCRKPVTHQLTGCINRVLLGKLIVTQLAKKCPSFMESEV
jgi:hypothetical protein